MSERAMRGRLTQKVLMPLGAFAVENPANPGTPDVNYSSPGGWLELKKVLKRPARKTTPIRVEHFRQEQRVFIEWMVDHGHEVWVVLQLERDWFVFPPLWACYHLGHVVEDELWANAAIYWKGRLDGEGLCRFLSSARVSDYSYSATDGE